MGPLSGSTLTGSRTSCASIWCKEANAVIKFIEKKPWTDHSPFTGQTYAPNYMVKDGVEYFMVNRVGSSDELNQYGAKMRGVK